MRDGVIGAAVSARKMLTALQCRIDRVDKEAAEMNHDFGWTLNGRCRNRGESIE